MKQIKLDVIKLINDDVIATSEFCTNHHMHEIWTSLGVDGVASYDDTYRVYFYINGEWYYIEENDDLPQNMSLNTYYDIEDLVACTKHHNPNAATLDTSD